MQRFRLKQWRETFEEVIIEAEHLEEAKQIGEDYPEYAPCAVEVVTETETTLRVEVEPIETTAWTAVFDDPRNGYSAELERFETEDHTDSVKEAKDKAIAWLGRLCEPPYHYPLDIPQTIGEWKATIAPQVDTLILTLDFPNGAWLTLLEIYQPR